MLLSLDPSINNTGYAVFDDKQNIVASGVIKSEGETIPDKLHSISRGVVSMLHYTINQIIIEIPAPFSYQRSTHNGKAMNLGALQKLNMATGVLIAKSKEIGINPCLIEAHKWKVRRSKKYDTALACSISGRRVKSDEGDAILMGIWYLAGGGRV